MKLKYNGIKETTRRSGGCNCGGGGSVKRTVKTHKELGLPSGAFKMFRINQITEVSDSDGEWLLDQYGSSFEVVQ